MQFISALFALAGLTLAAANTVEFVNMGSEARHIVFTPQEGNSDISTITIAGESVATQDFPDSWIGNFYSYNQGSANVVGMLGEVRWNGFAGANYFDVSAIVNPSDNEGVKMMFPKLSSLPLSGCHTFPCANAYNQPDDVATLSTNDETIICLLGNLFSDRRRSEIKRMPVPREFIEA